jgi:hypothetical protein
MLALGSAGRRATLALPRWCDQILRRGYAFTATHISAGKLSLFDTYGFGHRWECINRLLCASVSSCLEGVEPAPPEEPGS